MQDLEYGEKTENVENEKCALYALEYWEKTEKRGKRDTHTVGLGIWRENLKRWKMRHKHGMTWIMARNTEKREK